MSGATAFFVLGIIAITTFGWVATSWIRARHGYPLTDDWGNTVSKDLSPEAARHMELLATENEGLKSKIGRLEERIAVLERIATDPSERTAREIDNLR